MGRATESLCRVTGSSLGGLCLGSGRKESAEGEALFGFVTATDWFDWLTRESEKELQILSCMVVLFLNPL